VIVDWQRITSINPIRRYVPPTVEKATVSQVMALRLRLHLAKGEGQLYHPLSASEPPGTGLGGSEL
jgi:hypothetical protein